MRRRQFIALFCVAAAWPFGARAQEGKPRRVGVLLSSVGSGLIASLARPGGNVTGLANQIEIVSEKNFELLKESRPGIKRVGIMFSPANAPSAKTAKTMQEEIGPRL